MPRDVSDEIVRGPKFSLTHWYNRLVQVVLITGLLFVCFIGYAWCSGNAKIIKRSKEAILTGVNEELTDQGLHEINTISLPGASMWLGVPDVIEFENFLKRDENSAAGRYMGSLKGQLDRETGIIKMTITLGDGTKVDAERQTVPESEEED
jgi:hypothetical protein